MAIQRKIYACSACALQHPDDPVRRKRCCYETCGSHVAGSENDVLRSDCAKSCEQCTAGAPEFFGASDRLFYSECTQHTKTSESALACCLAKCDDSHDCEERCINAYNSTIPVESFSPIVDAPGPLRLSLLALLFFLRVWKNVDGMPLLLLALGISML